MSKEVETRLILSFSFFEGVFCAPLPMGKLPNAVEVLKEERFTLVVLPLDGMKRRKEQLRSFN